MRHFNHSSEIGVRVTRVRNALVITAITATEVEEISGVIDRQVCLTGPQVPQEVAVASREAVVAVAEEAEGGVNL